MSICVLFLAKPFWKGMDVDDFPGALSGDLPRLWKWFITTGKDFLLRFLRGFYSRPVKGTLSEDEEQVKIS